MNKKTIYSLGLIVLFVGFGIFLLKNKVETETLEDEGRSGPIPGAINIDVSDIFEQNPEKTEEEIYTSEEVWNRVTPHIKNEEVINDSSYKTIDYTAQDSNGNDYAVDNDGKKISQPTEEENKLLKETMKWASDAAPTKRIVITNLRNGNIDNLVAATHPDVIKDNGLDVVKDAYVDYVAYFKDFKFLDEDNGVVSRLYDDNEATIGIIFQEFFDTTLGNKKVFTITMMLVEGKYYVEEIGPEQTIKDINER